MRLGLEKKGLSPARPSSEVALGYRVKRVNRQMDMLDVWMRAPSNLSLGEKDVHVWRSNLDLPTASLQSLGQLLSREERMRAERFYLDRDRKRYVAAHGILRSIMAFYLGL